MTTMTEHDAIESAIEAFAAAYAAGDLTAVMAYYDDDLVKLRHGAEPETKIDTARRIAAVFSRFKTRVDVENVEIEISGELAFTRGTFALTLTPKAGGGTQRFVRRYLEIWRKRDGQWRVARTMDNAGEPDNLHPRVGP